MQCCLYLWKVDCHYKCLIEGTTSCLEVELWNVMVCGCLPFFPFSHLPQNFYPLTYKRLCLDFYRDTPLIRFKDDYNQ